MTTGPLFSVSNWPALEEWLDSPDHDHNCAARSEGQTCCLDKLRRPAPISASTRFCQYCGTRYELPKQTEGRVERTADIPPPATVVIWAVPIGRRIPDFTNDPIVHRCRNGVPE